MDNVDVVYILLVLSTLVVLYFFMMVANHKHKKQIHCAVLWVTGSILLWNFAVLFYLTFTDVPWILAICERLYFLGAILVSVSILFMGMIFAKTKIKFTWRHALLLVVPAISILVLLTNGSHHLFYSVFSLIPSQQDYGIYFTIHTIYSYLCIGGGLAYLIGFSIRNYGVFSKQSSMLYNRHPHCAHCRHLQHLRNFRLVHGPLKISSLPSPSAFLSWRHSSLIFERCPRRAADGCGYDFRQLCGHQRGYGSH